LLPVADGAVDTLIAQFAADGVVAARRVGH
jgi:hypothetical protein